MNNKINYIYWFAYYNLDSPSVRYRAKYPLDYVRKKFSIESCLVIPGYNINRLINFIRAYLSALLFPKENSLIIVQRVHSNFIYSNLLKLLVGLRKKRTVYDLDDADYLEHDPRTIHFFARNCRFIAAGSTEILKYLKQYNKHVFHLTSPTADLGISKTERNTLFTIGWIGGYGWGHRESLTKLVFPAIKELPFDCRFVILGVTKAADKKVIIDYFKNESHVELIIPKSIDWNDEEDIQNRIKTFDLGIATLLNHPVQLAKSGIKAKQYINNGVPVLCNNLPENNKVIRNGYNGFICDSPNEFKERMIQFKAMNEEEYAIFSSQAKLSSKAFNHNNYFEELERNILN